MPDPHLIEVAIAPRSKAKRAKLVAALDQLAADDLTFGVFVDDGSGQILLKGTSEDHLDRKVDALRRLYEIDIEFGAPQVAYRETLTMRVEKDYTHKTRSGGEGQFARVKIIFEPSEAGGFESQLAGGAVPDQYIAGVERGVNKAMASGVLAGFPVIDVKAALVDGAFHERDSSALAFEIAARSASREALREGRPLLLEPIMKVEITIPDDYIGFVTGDLAARRGRVQHGQMQRQDAQGDAALVQAEVPLANMFGYVNQLRSGTQGRGTYTMRFSHYAPAPPYPSDDGPAAPAIALRA